MFLCCDALFIFIVGDLIAGLDDGEHALCLGPLWLLVLDVLLLGLLLPNGSELLVLLILVDLRLDEAGVGWQVVSVAVIHAIVEDLVGFVQGAEDRLPVGELLCLHFIQELVVLEKLLQPWPKQNGLRLGVCLPLVCTVRPVDKAPAALLADYVRYD